MGPLDSCASCASGGAVRAILPKLRRSCFSESGQSCTKYKTTSLPRLVTPAKVPDMVAQLQGMLRTPWVFVSAKIKFLTVGSRRNGHPQI